MSFSSFFSTHTPLSKLISLTVLPLCKHTSVNQTTNYNHLHSHELYNNHKILNRQLTTMWQPPPMVACLPVGNSYSGPLEDLLPAPDCSACYQRQSLPAERQNRPGLAPGLIAWLPHQNDIPSTSCVHNELDNNTSAFNHPCVVLAMSKCQHLVFCSSVTSFGETSIQEKYRPCQEQQHKARIFSEYIALRRKDTISHNGLGELDQYITSTVTTTTAHANATNQQLWA